VRRGDRQPEVGNYLSWGCHTQRKGILVLGPVDLERRPWILRGGARTHGASGALPSPGMGLNPDSRRFSVAKQVWRE